MLGERRCFGSAFAFPSPGEPTDSSQRLAAIDADIEDALERVRVPAYVVDRQGSSVGRTERRWGSSGMRVASRSRAWLRLRNGVALGRLSIAT